MKQENVIEINNVTVRFNIASQKVDNFKEYFIKLIKKELLYKEFIALNDVSLNIKKGESWGLIGTNGSGKSTLLKLICRIIPPYQGSVETKGIIAPMIELGAGFDGNLTAKENVYLNGAILGYNKRIMMEKYDEIVDFAELEKFMEVPVKNFSSGMRARLGFAIATAIKPDILVVDEVLAVGDQAFQKKCEVRMNELLNSGVTLLYVSHSINSVKNICQKALWISKGKIIESGEVNSVCNSYTEFLKQK